MSPRWRSESRRPACDRYDPGHTHGVKTAVSLPDEVFERATAYAKRLGISRSELVARALRAFLDDARAAEVRASYDRAFGPDTGDDDTAALRREAARRRLLDVDW